jgi:hypothetical protein
MYKYDSNHGLGSKPKFTPPKGLFGSTPIHMDWGGLRGFQSLVSQNPLQSISIPSIHMDWK